MRSVSHLSLFVLCLFIGHCQSKTPNILLLLSDDHSIGAVGHLATRLKGYTSTPHIDQLASDGMTFTQAAVENSVCSPGRAALFTSQYTHKHKVAGLSFAIDKQSSLLPKILGDNGYDTAVIGKWHLGTEPQTMFMFSGVTRSQGEYFNPTFYYAFPNGTRNIVKYNGYASDVYTEHMIDWLDNQWDRSKPFFASVHYKAPHSPYDYPDRYETFLKGVVIPEPKTLYDKVEGGTQSKSSKSYLTNRLFSHIYMRGHYLWGKKDKRTPIKQFKGRGKIGKGYQWYMTKYLRCLKALDDGVGKIVQWVRDNQLDDDTIVIYTSDQGYFLGEHGIAGKRLILDESMRIPLIFRYPPKIPKQQYSNIMVQNIDIAPTILDMITIKSPSSFQGQSFKNVLYGNTNTWHTNAQYYAYFQRAPLHHGVRTLNFTYAKTIGSGEIKEDLYDNINDPEQSINVSGDTNYNKLLQEARLTLAQKMNEIGIYDNRDIPGLCPRLVPELSKKCLEKK